MRRVPFSPDHPQQRVIDYRWDELWRWMVVAQGMDEREPETKELFLTYLKKNFFFAKIALGACFLGTQ